MALQKLCCTKPRVGDRLYGDLGAAMEPDPAWGGVLMQTAGRIMLASRPIEWIFEISERRSGLHLNDVEEESGRGKSAFSFPLTQIEL